MTNPTLPRSTRFDPPRQSAAAGCYLIEVWTVEDFALAAGPMLCTATLIARLMPAAISAYSIEVAADAPRAGASA